MTFPADFFFEIYFVSAHVITINHHVDGVLVSFPNQPGQVVLPKVPCRFNATRVQCLAVHGTNAGKTGK